MNKGAAKSREWDPNYKPRWKIELEEKQDNAWLEAGPYQFMCDRCRTVSTRRLPAVKKMRAGCKCPACGHFVKF